LDFFEKVVDNVIGHFSLLLGCVPLHRIIRMPWFSRRFSNSPLQEAAIQQVFETMFLARGGPPEMLLIRERHDVREATLWARLPRGVETAFPSMELADDSVLPERATFVAGYPAQFEASFEYDTTA
jgi:hypothetical protein